MNKQNKNVQILEWSSEKKAFFPITSPKPSSWHENIESFNNHNGNDSVPIGVFLLIISISILIILYFLWKHFISKHISAATLPPIYAASQTGDRCPNSPVVSFVHLISFRSNNLYQDDNHDVPIEIIVNDQPPDYYKITKTDSTGRDAKQTEAISQTPETPPPKYEELERY